MVPKVPLLDSGFLKNNHLNLLIFFAESPYVAHCWNILAAFLSERHEKGKGNADNIF